MAKKRKPQNAVLFHHPEAVDTSGPRLMGRHAAGEGFLKGFVRHSGVDAFYCQTLNAEHFDDFKTRLGALDQNKRDCHLVPLGKMGGKMGGQTGGQTAGHDVKTLMLPEPTLAPFAWRRRGADNRGYSLCGLSHTMASARIMDGLGDLLTAPLQPWDALICTSNAAKTAITMVLDNLGDYLNHRGGPEEAFKPLFQMPVIPLGVDCDAYPSGDKAERESRIIRRGLGIGEDDITVLYFGRLSFHAKAHPTPMYLALEEATKRCGKKFHLIQAGWFANDGIDKEFREGAQAYCPSVNCIFLDGREADVRFKVWGAADIFTSLSDNIQETFGLTPIEAMAAGLPVVVSDWDGYRDTVRHGVDGFTIPTWLPLAGSGGDLALAPEMTLSPTAADKAYDHYLGFVSQCASVDIAAATEAYVALANDLALRKKMGDAGRKRARDTFDWRIVVGEYQTLWRDLENIRNREDEIAPAVPGRPPVPLRDDPFTLFEGYATETIDGNTVASLVFNEDAGDLTQRLDAVRAQYMNVFAAAAHLDRDEQDIILSKLDEEGHLDILSLAELFPADRRYLLARTIAWLVKMGIVHLDVAVGEPKS
ncbi:MAG: glycosyltransferase family 4 protein [Rhodospirillales bacterium]|nr:glycosyltransferase family 4 protein [Rhodospirillales bacterium]